MVVSSTTQSTPAAPTARAAPTEPADADLRDGLRALAYELTLAESRARERLARELHDSIGQVLAVARFRLDELRELPRAQQQPLFDEVAELLHQATQATRGATFELSSPALRLGLQEALAGLVQRLNRPGRTRYSLHGEVPPLPWPEEAQAVLFRVLRELVCNVERHAHAGYCCIEVGGDAHELVVVVRDDGVGIDPHEPPRGLSRDGGFGWPSALAQVRALGGSLHVESALGAGLTAVVKLPLTLVAMPTAAAR